ncbi:patatin-like phospholipase family protein [Amnibacterium sp.]|uniref:patatin-like phospholipase family protein n=1 Tax=Amnibacterium sp. TaxID=1872496 RepID=UPI003F7C2675
MSAALPSPSPIRRALVLGGGGAVGNAWLLGVLAGLLDAGLDVTDADLTVGTSAGATAAVQLGTLPLPDLFAAATTPPPAQQHRPSGGVPALLERTGRLIATSADADEMRRRIGAAFLELDATGAASARWRATVAARLVGADWPERRVLLTAVDARAGEGVVFERGSGVDVVDAVAASTAGASAYRIGDRAFIDGGYRRNENADLAAGADRVLVLSPLGGRTRHPLAWRMQLDAQVEDLRAAGSRVETVLPDEAALAVFGDGMMDVARRPPAARAGFTQGRALADRLGPFWS